MDEDTKLRLTYPRYAHWEEDEQTLYERDPFEIADEEYDRANGK